MDCDVFKTIKKEDIHMNPTEEVKDSKEIRPYSLWQNNKNKHFYVVEVVVPDFTNAREGQEVVLYYRSNDIKIHGVREVSEFLTKFTEVKK